MSGISSIGSTFIPLTTGTSTPSVTNTGTQGSTSPSVSFFQDALGVPLAGNNLGLPTGGAPGDSEALLALIALKLRQTIGMTNNNAVQSRANQYAQMLQQAQSIIAAVVNASNDLVSQQTDLQTTQTAIDAAKSKLQVLYTPLTGDGNQQSLQAVTPDPSGKQGTYGQYLAAFQDFQSKNSAYQSISSQVSKDQDAYSTALGKASTTDPNAYYTSVYQFRINQQNTLLQKQSQLAGLKPPQQLSASDQTALNTLSGPSTTVGSVAEASSQFTALNNDVANTLTTLQTDQGKQATAQTDLIAAQKALIPYLDYTSDGRFEDKYPQNNIVNFYTFDPQAVAASTPKSTGIISASMNLITDLTNNKKALTDHLAAVKTQITTDSGIIADFNNHLDLLIAFSQGVAAALSQHGTDQTDTSNANHSNDAILHNRLESNNDNLGALNESQDLLSKLEALRRKIAAIVDTAAGQTAIQVASDLTNALLALNELVDQPPVVPTSSDLFQNTPSQSQSSGSRMRIPV